MSAGVANALREGPPSSTDRSRALGVQPAVEGTGHRVSAPSALSAAQRECFLAAAAALKDEIARASLRESAGGATWRAPRRPASGGPATIGPHLYGGTAGVAVFFAAFAQVEGDKDCRALALSTLAPLRRVLGGMVLRPERATERLGIGGLSGLGGFLYSFVRVGTFLQEPSLIREAHAATTLITPQRLAGDRLLDIVSGSAGAVLALLALDAVAPEANDSGSTPLELAESAGRHLLSTRCRYGTSPGLAWKTRHGRPPLTGFAHGAAGISYALQKLFERTAEPSYIEAAEEGIAYERHAYLPERGNWRDLRFDEDRCGASWCHGAPGIALGRAAGLGVADDPRLEGEIRVGLETTRHLALSPFDNLCCGNAGRAEILLRARGSLNGFDGEAAAVEIVERMIRRSASRGGYVGTGGGEAASFDPGLFTGAAGVGYTLLRCATGHLLPSVLLLE